MTQSLLQLLRPHQWVKNGFVLLPAFFALRITEWPTLRDALLGGVAFSLLASGIYILNDWRDREADRAHPIKQHRPLAAGTVPVSLALGTMAALMIGALALFAWLDLDALYLALTYLVMNGLYSIRLKHIAILDIFIIAMGFVLRVGVGALVVTPHVPLSMWIMVMTFLGALFLALAKRRDDVLLAAGGKQVRKAIDGYNLSFINGAMVMMASVLIVAYLQYVSNPTVMAHFGSEQLYVTAAFVVLGVLRYMQITFVTEKSGSPTKILLQDPFLQLTILGWLLSFVWIIYR